MNYEVPEKFNSLLPQFQEGNRGPQFGNSKKKIMKAAQPRFWLVSGPFWVRVGVTPPTVLDANQK